MRLAAAAAIATAFAIAVIGAGAAPVGPTPLSDVLGVTGEHGTAVSDAVHQAKEDLEEGDKVGPAVSEAACEAAHDRSTLPEGAQNAPGQQDREPKDCTHPSNAESDDDGEDGAAGGDEEAAAEEEGDEELNHGQAVSQAVREAKEGLEEGDKVGPAVSEAACEAAHDRSTLPEGAQNAPGQQDREPKDCTHPSNAGSDEEGEEEQSATAEHGKASAPGQQKKNH
jgi:hypothetical protein